jgi:hypothetical protein
MLFKGKGPECFMHEFLVFFWENFQAADNRVARVGVVKKIVLTLRDEGFRFPTKEEDEKRLAGDGLSFNLRESSKTCILLHW